MSDNVAAEASSVDPLKTVADALETAVQAAKDGAADAKATVDKALPAAAVFCLGLFTQRATRFRMGSCSRRC